MSQHSLASKTISKRNVAQSSVIFSVVVAVITLGVIATVAYVDIKEEIDSIATEKSIPEMIAEQKTRSEENRKKAELISQAEDLVVKIDRRADEIRQLEKKANAANNQLNVINTNLQSSIATEKLVNTPVAPLPTFKMIKAVQTTAAKSTLHSDAGIQQHLNSIFAQNHAFKIKSEQSASATGEALFRFSWVFKARSNMGMKQEFLFKHQLNTTNHWNAKTI